VSREQERAVALDLIVDTLIDARQRYLAGRTTMREFVNRCAVETLQLTHRELNQVWERVERRVTPP
jgi:hypothetical protein